MTELLTVVVYGVKSSPDEKESVPDQHRQVLAALARHARGDGCVAPVRISPGKETR